MRVALLAVAFLVACAAKTSSFSAADVGAPIGVSKSVDPTVIKEPGGSVTYSVTITNDSDGLVWIDDIVDDQFGDLDDEGGNACFDAPIGLHPRERVNCTFQRMLSGLGGSSHVNTVRVSGRDWNGNPFLVADDASVTFTARLIDLTLLKSVVAQSGHLNGLVRYSILMRNAGPETATDVQMADPAPQGITYLDVTASQGSCDAHLVGGHLLTCRLGAIRSGEAVTVEVVARVTERGSHRNTATVTGGGGRETNPADNVDSALTVVPFCLELGVAPRAIAANRRRTILARVTLLKDPVRRVKVRAFGPGVDESARTNARGIARLILLPTMVGTVAISVPEARRPICAVRHVRVVG